MDIEKMFIEAVNNDCDFNFADTVAEIYEEWHDWYYSCDPDYGDVNRDYYTEINILGMCLEIEYSIKSNDDRAYIEVFNVKYKNNDKQLPKVA